MAILDRFVRALDRFQQSHRLPAFAVAVVKRYGEDKAGSKTALLTYYGFLSLFPLLLLLTTATNYVIGSYPHLQDAAIRGVTSYFPLLGNQLAEQVQGLHRSGLALIVGVLFTIYGARGAADAFRKGVQQVWKVPESQRDTFPKSLLKSLALLLVGAVGFVTASVLATMAATAGQSLAFRALSLLLDAFLLFWVFNFLLDFSLPKRLPLKETRVGAAVAAIGWVILQSLGGIILAHQLKHLDALYSYFAIALGLMFWLYLQAQILYYAMEIAYVHSHKLWPRSISGSLPTEVDKKLQARGSRG
ncbi:MAG TPA: YhjD/YihY/BrkB family envelope integrity protein [Candidatus Saccharimonadales bacterium]|nr:YhjD/YihY/BrkB family envelope integrity protein [Candidatus Saccharimonadales bacterium]